MTTKVDNPAAIPAVPQLDDVFTGLAAEARDNGGKIVLSAAPETLDPVALHRRDQRDFRQLVKSLTPLAWVTPTLFLILTGIFTWTAFQPGVDPLGLTAQQLIKYGGNYPPLTGSGEWWRLVTAFLLHAGVWHLLANCWALAEVGRVIERFVGNLGFFLAFVACGLASSLAGYWWSGDRVIVGASGAVFGITGVLSSWLWIRGYELPDGALRRIRPALMTFLIFNLALGAMDPQLDEAGHLGGYLMGVLLGTILAGPLTAEGKKQRIIRNLATVVVSCGVLFGAWKALPPPPVNLEAAAHEYEQTLSKVLTRHDELARSAQSGTIQREALIRSVQTELIKPTAELKQKWDDYFPQATTRQQERIHQVVTYLQLRLNAWQSLIAYVQSGLAEDREKFAAEWRAANDLARRLSSP